MTTAAIKEESLVNLRIVTWNLWWRFGPWESREDAIARVLLDCSADVCCLQEVWSNAEGSLAKRLAGRLEMFFVSFDSPSPGFFRRRAGQADVGVGNAILSRSPITRSAWEPLPPGAGPDEGRLVGFAELATQAGPLPVFTAQLNSGLTDSHLRVAQIAAIAEFIERQAAGPIPPILAGDFNCEPDSDEVRMLTGRSKAPTPGFGLRDGWRLASDAPGATWSRRNPYVASTPQLPDSRIDYIFLGYPRRAGFDHRILSGELVGTEPIAGVWPSDHFGVCLNAELVGFHP
jgi:endonuclease/exonuclease/phosphatase family metal-dependent hydrolase